MVVIDGPGSVGGGVVVVVVAVVRAVAVVVVVVVAVRLIADCVVVWVQQVDMNVKKKGGEGGTPCPRD